MRILLTNDDGPDSPLLRTAIRCIRQMGETTVVVPAEEQSWTAKRMTRFSEIRKTVIEVEGEAVHCLGGSPADCTNFGIYHMFDKKPDLVVSGINIGKNTGLGYTLSSGTVGACLEANIAGVPGVALSQELVKEEFQYWMANRKFSALVGERLNEQLEKLIENTFELLGGRPDFPNEPVTWNANFPYQPAVGCELKRTLLGHTFYGSYFEGKDGVYAHNRQLSQPKFDRRDGADGWVLKQGHASITRIDIREFGQDVGW